MPPVETRVLYYIHDPMCSWCWGYRAVWKAIQRSLPEGLLVEMVLGGLAPDTNEPMPQTTQDYVKDNWRRVQQSIPGVTFNYDFWSKCQPRRATYPACRAVLAAKKQDAETEMNAAIQKAYYLEARNPSDDAVLIALAETLGLDVVRFSDDLHSSEIQQQLEKQIQHYHQLSMAAGVSGFPSLVLNINDTFLAVPRDYLEPDVAIHFIECAIKQYE